MPYVSVLLLYFKYSIGLQFVSELVDGFKIQREIPEQKNTEHI